MSAVAYIIYEPDPYEPEHIYGVALTAEDAREVIRESTEFARALWDTLPPTPSDIRGKGGEYLDEWFEVIGKREEMLKGVEWPHGIDWGLAYNEDFGSCPANFRQISLLKGAPR